MIDPEQLKATLSERGITVVDITPPVMGCVVVHLAEDAATEWERAEAIARDFPEVTSVTVAEAPVCHALMFVTC